MGNYLDSRQEDKLPKYVQKDLEILYNYEFDEDERYNGETDHRMARKLFQIAKNYPQKHLWAILEYFGYIFDEYNIDDEDRTVRYLEPKDYRNQILHMAEEHFIEAMNEHWEMYYEDNIKRQSYFIDIGLIDCFYSSKKEFRERAYKNPKYLFMLGFDKYSWDWKYPQAIEYRDTFWYKNIINWISKGEAKDEIFFESFHNSEYYKVFVDGKEYWDDNLLSLEDLKELCEELEIEIEPLLKGEPINVRNLMFDNQFTRYYPKIESTYI